MIRLEFHRRLQSSRYSVKVMGLSSRSVCLLVMIEVLSFTSALSTVIWFCDNSLSFPCESDKEWQFQFHHSLQNFSCEGWTYGSSKNAATLDLRPWVLSQGLFPDQWSLSIVESRRKTVLIPTPLLKIALRTHPPGTFLSPG
ncbi:hypothetical protein NPIL_187031 [Nephila pilipes]|uniref:Uncharacterized protein n=1 Tax=Nephila pilipes TaxID=299642 RepID=A0A8X6QSZ3_NEPPI|nr:hypothetical protein NPIL_187031 [Nephila pilipes]